MDIKGAFDYVGRNRLLRKMAALRKMETSSNGQNHSYRKEEWIWW